MSDGAMITLPVLPLRDIVVFPHMIVPLFVGREKSIRALEAVMAEDKQIILVTQKEADTEVRTLTACTPSVRSDRSCSC